MSRDGNGVYNLPVNSWNPAVDGNAATTVDWQSLIDDVATALTQSVSSDGQTPMTGDLNMNGNRIESLAAGASTTDAANVGQIYNQGIEQDVASAATTDIGIINSNFIRITGTVTITSLGTNYRGPRFVRFSDALILTHNATTLILPGGANITTAAGDRAIFVPKGNPSDGWNCVSYEYASGSIVTGNVSVTGNLAVTGIQSITANSSSAALTVTQTGSGDVVNFLDSAGDVSYFKVDTNGAVTIANNPSNSNLFSSTYTPTLTNGGNVDSSTAFVCQYMVVGAVCTVSGSVEINTAASGVASEIEMSLPVASDFSSAQQAGGTFVNASATDATLRDCGSIRADATDNRVIFRFFPATSANQTYYFSFTYAIV